MRQPNKNHTHPNDPARPGHFRGERYLPPYTHAYARPVDPWHGNPHVLPEQRNLAAGLNDMTRELPTLEMLAATKRLAEMGIHEADETATHQPVYGAQHASREVAADIGHVPQHLHRR